MTTSTEQQLAQFIQRSYAAPAGEVVARLPRFTELVRQFSKAFGTGAPHAIVRAPGRVNIIGEHTDYNGYPVFPMAIDRDVVMAVSASSDQTVEVVNTNPRYERCLFEARFPLEPYSQGDWGNYIKAAVNGILEAKIVDRQRALGFRAVVGGTIPESAGLSSSSALVVAAALAFLTSNNTTIGTQTLADLLAHAERYVGSEGGGMDQAVSLLAEARKGLKIDFFPLRTQSIDLPTDLEFVVCNSLIRAPKTESAQYAYNRRVVECRLAAVLLSKALSDRTGKGRRTTLLADMSPDKLKMDEREVNAIAEQAIGEEPLSLAEISQRLQEPVEAVRARCLTLKSGGFLAEPREGFLVWKRYRHVVTEGRRVEAAVQALQAGNTEIFGELMNQSHSSCRDDFEISCPELDALASISRLNGALGARLTGAGFGGCTVNAVPTARVDEFIRRVTSEYYEGFVTQHRGREFIRVQDRGDAIFRSRASSGAAILLLN